MTFGEKVKKERKKLKMSQETLSEKVGVSRRTITAWETNVSLPRTRKVYERLAAALEVPVLYLVNEDEAFVIAANEEFGYRGRKEAEELVNRLTGLFAGGEMADEDMDAMVLAIQQAYVNAKRKNKKYTPKKFLRGDDEQSPES